MRDRFRVKQQGQPVCAGTDLQVEVFLADRVDMILDVVQRRLLVLGIVVVDVIDGFLLVLGEHAAGAHGEKADDCGERGHRFAKIHGGCLSE
ncbi:MAG: hypothetical protein R3E68_18460 [Burkholderiaceae bacterium]